MLSQEDIILALEKARCTYENSDKKFIFSNDLLIDYGLIAATNSAELREKLGNELGIGYSNGKQFLSKLNKYNIVLRNLKGL